MAYSFDEVNDRLVVGDDAALDLPDGDWTIGGLIKFDDNVGSFLQYFYSHGTVSTNNSANFVLSEASDVAPNEFRAFLQDGGGDTTNNVAFTPSLDPDAGNWNHFCFRRRNNIFSWFWGGDELQSLPNGNTIGDIDSVSPAGSLFLGARNDLDADRFFGGDMAEWAKWDRGLSDVEIGLLADRFSPQYVYDGCAWHIPMESDNSELVAGLTVTVTGPTIATHPGIRYPTDYPPRQTFHEAIEQQLSGSVIGVADFVTMDFKSKYMRLWPGFGPIELEGEEWTGVGNLGRLSAIRVPSSQAISEVVASIAGGEDLLRRVAADRDETSGREMRVRRQFFRVDEQDGDSNIIRGQPIGPMLHIFRGTMGPVRVEFGGVGAGEAPTRTAEVSAQDPFVNTRRPRFSFWADRDQQARSPGDNLLKMMSRVRRIVKWPDF